MKKFIKIGRVKKKLATSYKRGKKYLKNTS